MSKSEIKPMRIPKMYDYAVTKFTLAKFFVTGRKSALNRITDKAQGYGVGPTPVRLHTWINTRGEYKSKITGGKFIKVRNGNKVQYFPVGKKVFWNLYRITSIVGTKDYVTHSV